MAGAVIHVFYLRSSASIRGPCSPARESRPSAGNCQTREQAGIRVLLVGKEQRSARAK